VEIHAIGGGSDLLFERLMKGVPWRPNATDV